MVISRLEILVTYKKSSSWCELFYVAAKRNGYKLYDIILTKITKCCKLHILCEIVKTVKICEKLEQGQLYKLKTLGKRIKSFEI